MSNFDLKNKEDWKALIFTLLFISIGFGLSLWID
tara:strand:- start:472 stop:573 length:102 start_codon:yes stop_codon:yes gene_type:complete